MAEAQTGFQFSRFMLIPRRRELLADGVPVKLGRRAFDLLAVLVESQGLLVSKDDLLRRVWPSTFVHENNIEVQVSAIRKVLGEDHDAIQTLPGRGYRLNAVVSEIVGEDRDLIGSAPGETRGAALTNVPAQMSDLVGRSAEAEEVAALLSSHRIITLTGAGGMGKTRLALEVAQRVTGGFPDGAWLAELAPILDPELLPGAVAAAFGLPGQDELFTERALADALRSKRALLVLDNCEHLVEAVARLGEALLRAAPGLRVLATSQEPLRVEGECTYRLPSLSVPGAGALSTDEALDHSAVRLFVARAQAADPHFRVDDANAQAIGTICRRLDGIPLAIELAAARTATLAIEQIAAGLDHRFELLTGGRRTALARHQTLQALLDWSYSLLSQAEQVTLRRLSVFRGSFSIDAAREVAGGSEGGAHAVDEALAGLVAKSLAMAEVGGLGARYRLLETTRTYAFDRLEGAGEANTVLHWHADHFRAVLETGGPWKSFLSSDWLSARAPEIDDIRAAVQWAFSPEGDPAIGCALAAASTPVLARLSLFGECGRIIRRALAQKGSGEVLAPRSEMHLQAALAMSITPTHDLVDEKIAASNRALDLAERLGDVEYQLRGLLSLYRAHCWNNQAASVDADRFLRLASERGSWSDTLVGRSLVGTCLFRAGEGERAEDAFRPVLEADLRSFYDSQIFRFGMNAVIQASARMGSTLWLQGRPDEAVRASQASLEAACASGHLGSLCHTLAEAGCLFALLLRDREGAEQLVARLLALLDANALGFGRADAMFLKGYLAALAGDVGGGLATMRTALRPIGQVWICHYAPLYLGRFAEVLGRAGEAEEAHRAINEAIGQAGASADRWCAPELLRIKRALPVAGAPESRRAARRSNG